MLKQAAALSDAVRLRVVLKYGGQLCFVLSAFTLAPLEMQEPGADVEGGPHLRSTREVIGYNSAGATLSGSWVALKTNEWWLILQRVLTMRVYYKLV